MSKPSKSKEPELSIALMRHLLGSIDLSDIEEDKEMSEGERKEYCATISAVFPRLEKEIKKFLHAQLMFSANQAEDWDKVVFGRGTYNGIDLLYQHWKTAHVEHTAKGKPKEEFDKHSPIGEVSE